MLFLILHFNKWQLNLSWDLCFYQTGKGSYGAVYKARDIQTSELVAIKVISLSEGVWSLHIVGTSDMSTSYVNDIQMTICYVTCFPGGGL